MSNPKSFVLAVIPADILLTKLGWKSFSPACWSWLPRTSTSCPHAFNASSLTAGLPLLCWLGLQGMPPQLCQGPTYYPAGGPGDSPSPCFCIAMTSAEPQSTSTTQKTGLASVPWCTQGLLLVKVKVILVTELSGRGRRLLQSIRVSCSSSQL